MAMRSAMHRAGAAALSRLLSMDGGHPAQLDCACGQTARYHDTRPKQLLTVLGPLELRRAYYHCAHCRQGHSPRDRELDVEGTQCSPGVRRMLSVVGSESSFEQGRAQLELLAGLDVTTKAVERHAESIGADSQCFADPLAHTLACHADAARDLRDRLAGVIAQKDARSLNFPHRGGPGIADGTQLVDLLVRQAEARPSRSPCHVASVARNICIWICFIETLYSIRVERHQLPCLPPSDSATKDGKG